MNSNLKENDITDYRFKHLPSDGDGLTDVDVFDDQDYFLPQKNTIKVVE